MNHNWSGDGCQCEPTILAREQRSIATPRESFTQSPPNRRIPYTRPPPARRRSYHAISSLQLLLTTLFFLVLSTPTLAFDRSAYEQRRSPIEGLENDIIFDPAPMPEPPLFKRQFSPGEESSSTASSIEAPTSTSSSSDDSTTTGGIVAAQPTADTMPKAFDGGLGTNYTQPSCVNFLKDLVRNDTANACLPVSLFLQNSQSFFQASRSPESLDPVLSASCTVVPQTCSAVMANWALRMRSSSACSQDYDRQQPTVRQAYNGLISYEVLYSAFCKKATPSALNNQSSDFCYTNAVTNISSPTDVYPYYLPLGVSLPAGSMPTCSKCLQDTMGMFAEVARNKSSPLSLTYVNAAQQVNLQCGPAFVNQTIPGAKGTGAANGLVGSMPNLGVLMSTTVLLGLAQISGLM